MTLDSSSLSPLHLFCDRVFFPRDAATALSDLAAADVRGSGRCGHTRSSWALLPQRAHPDGMRLGHVVALCPGASQIQHTTEGDAEVATARRGMGLKDAQEGK